MRRPLDRRPVCPTLNRWRNLYIEASEWTYSVPLYSCKAIPRRKPRSSSGKLPTSPQKSHAAALQESNPLLLPAPTELDDTIELIPLQPLQPLKRSRRPRQYPLLTAVTDVTVLLQASSATSNPQFTSSRQKEVTGVLEKGVFEITQLEDLPRGVRLFNSRFVDEVKNAGTDKAFEKSRLVVQAYNDREKELVLTQSPKIQLVSQRLILCLAAIYGVGASGALNLHLRDISQVYVQSTTDLNGDFYVRPPPELQNELGLGKDAILKVLRPLYGVPEAGNHWFKTYHSHHINRLQIHQSTYDPCLLQCNEPFGVVGLQTDDTLFLADEQFAVREQDKLHQAKFMAKDRETLTVQKPLKFNGGLIQLLQNSSITLTQERQAKNLSTIYTKNATSNGSRAIKTLSAKEQYIAQRARGAYIASVFQPESSFDLSFSAQVINPTEDDVKNLNKRLNWQIDNPTRGLNFVQLDVKSLQLLVFTDASFANNNGLSSQIGYDIGSAIKSTMDKTLQVDLPLVLCTDSKSLYECLVRLGTTPGKRLMIDVMCLRQAYERRQISEVKWVDGEANPADAMTKGKPCSALTDLINTNRIDLQAVRWVELTPGVAVE